MEKKIGFFQKKSIGFYLSLIAVACMLASFLAYRSAAGDMYGYDARVGTLFIVAMVVGAIFAYKDFFRVGPILVGILNCATFGVFINVRFVYFATVVTGIAQQGISTPITVATILLMAAIVVNLISGFLKNDRE